jgi:hypothetical protein
MGKYSNIQNKIFSIFNQTEWKAEEIKTIPVNFTGVNSSSEFIRVSIIPGSPGANRASISGILMIEIFAKAGEGPKRVFAIADILDSYLEFETLFPFNGVAIQFKHSNTDNGILDTDNPSLFKLTYTIPFIYTEVL